MVGVDGCGWVRLGVGESGGSWRWCGRGGPGWSRRRWWVRRGGSHAALRICVDSWRVRLRCPLSPSFVLRRDSGFLDTSTVCASCCARAESSRGRLRCRWLGSRSGVAITHVRLRPHTMHRDQQLEQEVGLAKCNSVLPLTMCLLNFVVPASCALSLHFLKLLRWSICCRLSFLCRLCTVLDFLFVFWPYLPICLARSSVPFLFSSYFDWFCAFFLWHPSSSTHVSVPLHTVSLFACLFAFVRSFREFV